MADRPSLHSKVLVKLKKYLPRPSTIASQTPSGKEVGGAERWVGRTNQAEETAQNQSARAVEDVMGAPNKEQLKEAGKVGWTALKEVFKLAKEVSGPLPPLHAAVAGLLVVMDTIDVRYCVLF